MLKLVCVAAIAALGACASNAESSTSEAPASEATQGAEPGVGAEPSAVPAEPIPSTNEDGVPPSEGSAGGRMAFTQCNPDDRPQACTREYRPVCAEVDNGVRCVTTPCDSTDQKEFANGCTACADSKTNGYWPVACAQLGQDAR